MNTPIRFVHGNCMFGSDPDDVWAAFAVACHSYQWLSEQAKLGHHSRLAGALGALGTDMQLLRVGEWWNLDRYTRGLDGRICDAHRRTAEPYVERQAARLGDLKAVAPRVFVIVSLKEPTRDVASYVAQAFERPARGSLRSLSRLFSPRGRGLLSAGQLQEIRMRADRARALLADFLPARPARAVELQWLIRRAFCRGLGEPFVDGLHEPRALAFEHNGQALLAPLEGQVIRWMDGCVESQGRLLRVAGERGESWQALLVLGALPDELEFPGPQAELMFSPLENLPFGVDVSVNARFLPNQLAVRMTRRRMHDADQIVRAEADGEHGVSDLGERRVRQARELLVHLQTSQRPPLLRCTLSLAIGATSGQELEERVDACRRMYCHLCLHRPLGDQLKLFIQHLPGQRARTVGYDDILTVEQLAAMMPTATHAVGSRSGFYLGHSLSRSRKPVLFNLTEGSERDCNTAILSVGALGSGKTTLAQKLEYEGFLQGARVIDCDPKGDHRFHLLDEVAPHAETIALRADPGLRGLLDPLRVAPAHMRHELTVSFLCDLLPARAEPAWETAILASVDRVMRHSRQPTCLEVVRALLDCDGIERAVGQALEVYARSGLTQLGFAEPDCRSPAVGGRQVTYISIRDLPSPRAETPRDQYTQAERVGTHMVRLIAMFAMDLMARERDRLKLFSFDEGWRLLGDPVGRTLLGSLQRMGRSELAVPIVCTQLVNDALIDERESWESLLGATFVFGMRSPAEAARALALLGLDGDDDPTRQLLLSMQAGRCLLRDHAGRIEAIQVDLAVSRLLRELSTRPSSTQPSPSHPVSARPPATQPASPGHGFTQLNQLAVAAS